MLVLASASPRRAELLGRIGLEFAVRPTRVDETPPPGLAPRDAVRSLARRKAEAAAANEGADEFILAADTAVVLDNRWMGKPANAAEAARTLAALSGRRHEVLTGVDVRTPQGRHFDDVVESAVVFRRLTPQEIDAYVATGEPLDKAGAYGVQGLASAFVERLEGDYTSVVGLPLRRTLELLAQAGYALPPKLKPL